MPVQRRRMSDASGFDPFQVFEVSRRPCVILYITVLDGRNITKGWAQDWVDTPDPYLTLTIKTSPNSCQKTSVKDNDIHPVWNETFKFFLDPDTENVLEISLMDANYTIDEHLCTKHFKLDPLPLDKAKRTRVQFNETSEVDIEMWAEVDDDPRLRYSLALCTDEKHFVDKRRRKVLEAMNEILREDAPRTLREVPIIGVLGSGGGFRAMTALGGVLSALYDSRILDMCTYVAGLSGSSWYISQLYSHPDWPQKSPRELWPELRQNISSSPFWLLKPQALYRYVRRILEKRKQGQPVSFTDLFGLLVGETILKGRMEAKLSDQQKLLEEANVPMPLYTCLHVKKHVSAMIFHEWMEFTPYEIGMPKYGTFLKPENFGCKFFMGQLVKQFPEPPLHFLQGIWGSAFCIQFKRLLQDDKQVDVVELMRQEREELEMELQQELDNQSSEDSDTELDSEEDLKKKDAGSSSQAQQSLQQRRPSQDPRGQTFWSSMLSRVFENSSLLQSIEGRAAMVHNFMRGLSLYKVYPFSPFAAPTATANSNGGAGEEVVDTFDGIFEMYPTSMKRLYVVDGGLTFNSPYPLLLRPQRNVDLLLSFDFSARPSDTTPPFKELLLAEKWARLNKIPFPPIDPTVVDREGLKECYVFKDPKDPYCPIVLHFVLVNIGFREEVAPGKPRRTKEEKEFADFDIFDDPERPYSTFNFKYSNLAFDRLTQLTEYNTLLNTDLILQKIRECIKRKKRHSIRRPIKLKDIKKLKLRDKKKEGELAAFIQSIDEEQPDLP